MTELPEKRKDTVCDNFAAKLSLYSYQNFVALERKNHFGVNFFLSEFHLDILISKFSVIGQSFITILKSILKLFRKYFYFKLDVLGKKCNFFNKREGQIILAVLVC